MMQVDHQTWNELMVFLAALEDKKKHEVEDRRSQLELPIPEEIDERREEGNCDG